MGRDPGGQHFQKPEMLDSDLSELLHSGKAGANLSKVVRCEYGMSLGSVTIGKKNARNKKDRDHFPS